MQPRDWTRIIDACCAAGGVTRADLFGQRRAPSRSRQLCYWLLRERLRLSYPQIARLIGWRDHTTVIYGCRKWAERRSDPACADLEQRALARLDRREGT